MSRNTIRAIALAAGLATAATAAPALAVTPVAKPTTIAIRAAAGTVKHGTKDNISATLKAGTVTIAGQTVRLYDRAFGGKTWKLVGAKVTGLKGNVVFSVVPGTKKGQKEQYEVVFAGNAKYKASHSAIVTINVS